MLFLVPSIVSSDFYLKVNWWVLMFWEQAYHVRSSYLWTILLLWDYFLSFWGWARNLSYDPAYVSRGKLRLQSVSPFIRGYCLALLCSIEIFLLETLFLHLCLSSITLITLCMLIYDMIRWFDWSSSRF